MLSQNIVDKIELKYFLTSWTSIFHNSTSMEHFIRWYDTENAVPMMMMMMMLL